jgi:dCTP deaminase
MAILTGLEISTAIAAGVIEIKPFNIKQLQPNSYDVTLSDKIAWYKFDDTEILDPEKEDELVQDRIPQEGFLLVPGRLYLLTTNEVFWSNTYVSEISGISSLARKGVAVHKTAGYANLGHRFAWVLEVEVTHPIIFRPNMRIGQVYFHTTKGSTSMQYEGLYGEQTGDTVAGAKVLENESPVFDDEENLIIDDDDDDIVADNSDEDYDGEDEDDTDIPVEDQTDDDE